MVYTNLPLKSPPSPASRSANGSRLTDRSDPSVPLYVQIADGLLEQIESGKMPPGFRLSPERELSSELQVNRMTVRRALRMLESQGLLIRRQGDGTYVAQPKIERQAAKLVSFTRGMERRGLKPGARIILFEQRPVEPSIARELRLRNSAPVFVIHRLRLINKQPVLLERYTIPAHRFPHLKQHDLVHRSMYEVMQAEYGVTIQRARQSLEPVIASEYEAGLLGLAPGDPLMLERRLSFDERDQPVEHGRDLYRGDRFRFVTEMAPLEM